MPSARPDGPQFFSIASEIYSLPQDISAFNRLALLNRFEVTPDLSEIGVDTIEADKYEFSGYLSEIYPTRNVKAIYRNHDLVVRADLPDGRTHLLPGENLADFITQPFFYPALPETVTVRPRVGSGVATGDQDIAYTVTTEDTGDPNTQRVNVDVVVSKNNGSRKTPVTIRKQISARVDPGAPASLRVYETSRPFNYVDPAYVDDKGQRAYLIVASDSLTLEAQSEGGAQSVDYSLLEYYNEFLPDAPGSIRTTRLLSSGRLLSGETLDVVLPLSGHGLSMERDFRILWGRDLDGDGTVTDAEGELVGSNQNYSIHYVSQLEYIEGRAIVGLISDRATVAVSHQLFKYVADHTWDQSPLNIPWVPRPIAAKPIQHGPEGRITHRFGYRVGQILSGDKVDIPFFVYHAGSAGSELVATKDAFQSRIQAFFNQLSFEEIDSEYSGDNVPISFDRRLTNVNLGLFNVGIGDLHEATGKLIVRPQFMPPASYLLEGAVFDITIDDVFDFNYFNTVDIEIPYIDEIPYIESEDATIRIPFPLWSAQIQAGHGVYGEPGQIFGVEVNIYHDYNFSKTVTITD